MESGTSNMQTTNGGSSNIDIDTPMICVLIITALITTIAITSNLALLIVFHISPEIRTTNHFFIICLLCADLSMAIMYPLICLVDLEILSHNPYCFILVGITVGINSENCLFLLALTVERYVMIRMPLRAGRLLSDTRVKTAAFVITGYSILLGVITIATPVTTKDHVNECHLSTIVTSTLWRWIIYISAVFPLIFMVIAYMQIFTIIRKHIRATSEPNTEFRPNSSERSNNSNSSSTSNIRVVQQRYSWKREVKAAVHLGFLVLYCAISWIPYAGILVKEMVGDDVDPIAYALCHAVVYTNIAINPFVFGFSKKEIRDTINRSFSLKFSFRKQVHRHNGNT